MIRLPFRPAIRVAPLGLTALLITAPAAAQNDPAALSAEGLVRALYDRVSSEAGSTPDWDVVRSAFLPQAVVVLRTSRDSTTVSSLEGFIQDFVDFIARANVVATGFRERVLRTRPMVFGDIAHVLVLYEAHIPGSGRPPQQGVDSFQLIRRNGRWWIVSITNELPTRDRPLPRELAP
jgi:hypothetical protein